MKIPKQCAFLELGPAVNEYTGHRAKFSPEWFTCGLPRRGPVDLNQDLNNPWNLPDGRFEIVYASQVLEHMIEVQHFLGECRRVLKKGGVLRLSVPDIRFFIRQYMAREISLRQLIKTFHDKRQYAHKHAFDPDSLRMHLEAASFKAIKQCEAGESRVEMMRDPYFSNRTDQSIYMEARR